MKKDLYFLYDMTTGEIVAELGLMTELESENYEDNSLRAIDEHQMLVEKSCNKIVQDVKDCDLTVIEGLLQVIDKQKLKDFLAIDE